MHALCTMQQLSEGLLPYQCLNAKLYIDWSCQHDIFRPHVWAMLPARAHNNYALCTRGAHACVRKEDSE